jgi:uncharacterized OsmC-like protein
MENGRMTSRPRADGMTTGMAGRFVMSARSSQIVADATPASGGPGEAFVAQELFLASLATCALAVIDHAAREERLPSRVHVQAESDIDPADTTRYRGVSLEFRFADVEQRQAEALVAAFTAVCPIYNTIARTTPVAIAVHIIPAAGVQG